MFTYAPRPNPNFSPLFPLLVLVFWLGLLCWTKPAYGFHFKDYGPQPHVTPPDAIQAKAVVLEDADTGEILYARNPDERLLPASTTKLMTALIVYEKFHMNGSVTVTEDDRAEPSNIPVVPGETISVNTLFHALLIESCNDSARVLGRAVAGSDAAFVDMMNQRALSMGLFNTHFHNPNGLPAPAGTHFTSCADLMVIFKAVLKYPVLAEIMQTKAYEIHTESGTHILRNHNRLLGYYPGMGPAKTGWTEASRHTYACEVTQNGHHLLLTLLDSPDKWHDAIILFNWGFARLNSETPENAAAR
ncbi:MAG TPA: D-alanyl-D-alanine carboxypeptidase family protein [Candidatus Methylacidiphilales bacterium]|jgi:D-alanyl-D-alanine carboxypeptidase|nr:D-alanyl-D-alanine carboxypeptidase family protein [Candidatus Methylacidiphilales bacterium]